MGIDRTTLLLPAGRKSHVALKLAHLPLTLVNSKGQCQGHAHLPLTLVNSKGQCQGHALFDSEHFVDDDIYDKHCNYQHRKSHRPFSWHIYI